MKHVLVIDDRQLPWDQIALGLQEANARISIFTLEEVEKALKDGGADLVVLGDGAHRLLPFHSREVPRLIISEEVPPGETIRAREGRNAIRLGWPVSPGALNDLASRILSVPERRTFRTPVLIGLRKGGASFQGSSEDFSLAGMSFKTEGSLEPREEITVSFSGHGERGGLKVQARVVRRHPLRDEPSSLYGAIFGKLSKEEQHALERFVWAIPRRKP